MGLIHPPPILVQDNTGAILSGVRQEIANVSPPNAGAGGYPAGGFVLDLSSRFSALHAFEIEIETPGSLPSGSLWEISRNTPDPGKVRIKLVRGRYNQATLGDMSAQNPPSGVTLQTASGAQVASESAHTHSASANQGTNVIGGSGDTAQVGAVTSAGSAHTHTDNNLYQHGHLVTQTPTDLSGVEITAASDLSSTVFRYVAIGVGV